MSGFGQISFLYCYPPSVVQRQSQLIPQDIVLMELAPEKGGL
jgi:hypothetical protein